VENASTFVGTPYFMAPEIIRNEPYNLPTDIWSIGCVIFELATFQHPFVGDKLHDVFNAILNDEPPSLLNLYSKELNGVLKK
jgi:serine/threonine protein kinase